MAHRYDPLHERIKLIVKNSGGYDFDYHMSKVAKENNIDKEMVVEIFRITTDENTRSKYIQLYKEGYSLDYIQRINDKSECKKQFDESSSRYL